ncbi:MAG: hypothetical protein WD871_03060 [Xanthobacteraceae bacterium]
MTMRLLGCRLLAVALMPVMLAACFETAGTPQYSVPGTTPAAGGANVSQQVRAKLESRCIDDSGVIFRADEKTTRQCGCYASAMAKSMSKDDLDFFANYGVVPTLGTARPDDVKKSCGMTVVVGGGPKAKLPQSESY